MSSDRLRLYLITTEEQGYLIVAEGGEDACVLLMVQRDDYVEDVETAAILVEDDAEIEIYFEKLTLLVNYARRIPSAMVMDYDLGAHGLKAPASAWVAATPEAMIISEWEE